MHAGADDADELVAAVHRIMAYADRVRRLRVRANADNAEDALRARRFGAQGIGLCRTEHMFLGDRRELVERLILADTEEEREDSLKELLPSRSGTSSNSSRRWTASGDERSVSWTRRCTSSCRT